MTEINPQLDIARLALKYRREVQVPQLIEELEDKLLPPAPDTVSLVRGEQIALVVYERTGLPPSEYRAMPDDGRLIWLQKAVPSGKQGKPPKRPILTEPMTKMELSKWFCCHRNQVDKLVLEKYSHKKDGTKFRLSVADMPVAYHEKHRAK